MTHVAPIHVGRFEVRTICEGFAPLLLSEEFPDEDVDWDAQRTRYPWGYHGADAWAWHVHAFVVEAQGSVVVVEGSIVGTVTHTSSTNSVAQTVCAWAAEDTTNRKAEGTIA